MKEKLKKHLFYYASLTAIFASGATLAIIAAPYIIIQSAIITLTVVSYIILGLVHHKLNHELTSKIVVEYVLIGALGISILFFMMGGVL